MLEIISCYVHFCSKQISLFPVPVTTASSNLREL